VNRQFSVIRRRPQVVDIMTPFVRGTAEYRLKYATNFDQVFTTIIAANGVSGYVDPTINTATLTSTFNNGQIRIVFDPTNAAYSITNPNSPIWLKFARYDGAVETYVSPPTLLLPDTSNHGLGVTTISGTAPAALDVTGSLQIDFPFLVSDVKILNQGVNKLYVATEPNGGEMMYEPDTVALPLYPVSMSLSAAQPQILVRGSGGTTDFSLTFTRAYPR
jgi:hypothetical protein